MSTRHLITRANEHLNVRQKSDSAINQHIRDCEHCSEANHNVSSFKILKKCSTEYETKIQEALLIKKLNPSMNKQLFSNGSSFLLNVF